MALLDLLVHPELLEYLVITDQKEIKEVKDPQALQEQQVLKELLEV
jgi:hypothetical protein